MNRYMENAETKLVALVDPSGVVRYYDANYPRCGWPERVGESQETAIDVLETKGFHEVFFAA